MRESDTRLPYRSRYGTGRLQSGNGRAARSHGGFSERGSRRPTATLGSSDGRRRGPYGRRSRRQAPFWASRSLCHGTCAVWLRAIDSFAGTRARSSVDLTVHEPPWSSVGFPAPLRSARPDPGSGRQALAARRSLAGERPETAVRRPPFGWADTGRASRSDCDFARFRPTASRSATRWASNRAALNKCLSPDLASTMPGLPGISAPRPDPTGTRDLPAAAVSAGTFGCHGGLPPPGCEVSSLSSDEPRQGLRQVLSGGCGPIAKLSGRFRET